MRVPWNATGSMFVDIPGMVAVERAKSAANAEELVRAFDAEATKRELVHQNKVERCMTASIPAQMIESARTRDLTIIPAGTEPSHQSYIAQSVVFGSGRPVLVVPEAPKRTGRLTLNSIGIAWDFSRPAARAIADALPMLRQAKAVHVATVTNEKVIDTHRSATDLARHLACHGVKVSLDEEDAAGRSIGTVLENYATSRELDVLVMGAYGHSRLRDFVVGGATKSLIANPSVPVFLSH